MKDRDGKHYVQGIDLVGLERTPRFTHVVSPSRQEKKALQLSGRQYKKFYKEQQRLQKQQGTLDGLVRELHDALTNPNVGEEHGDTQAGVQALPEQEVRSTPGTATDSAAAENSATEAGGQRGAEATQG